MKTISHGDGKMKLSIKRLPLCLVIVMILAVNAPANAMTAALSNFSGGEFTANDDDNLGWEFQVSKSIVVGHLGFFDLNGDGLATSHQVALWLGDGTLLAQATVQSATASPIIGATNDPGGANKGVFRYEAIEAVTLTPGNTYVISSLIENSLDLPIFNSTGTFNSQIIYLQGRYGSGPDFGFPGEDFGIVDGYFGPNFTFVPEPCTIALLTFGGLVLRKRK